MKAILFIFCSLLVLSSYAGDGTWVRKTSKKDLLVTQYSLFEPQRISGEDARVYNKMRAFVRLSYTRKSQTDVSHNSDWNMQVNFNYLLNGVTTAGSLTISNESGSRVYEDYLEIPLPSGTLGYSVTITSVTGNYGALNAGASIAVPVPQQSANIPADIDFIMELRSERVYNLNTAAVVDDISRISFVPADFKLYWTYQQGAEEYDLEWVFIDKHSPEYIQITAAEGTLSNELTGFSLPFELVEPTRVRVWGFNYQLDKAYPEGRLYFRVRAVSTFADQTNGISDDIRYGKWGYCIPSTQLTLCKYEITDVLQFEANKTWLYGISYADDGKSVSTLTYFDGSNRGRQNLTYNTSDHVTLVGESKYDKEGRQTVNVIPAPVIGRNLFYQSNFNMAASGNVFDESEIEQTTVPPLATISGSAKYFSKNNDFTGDLFRDAVPNANGYVFSQTVFRNDGTGRIERVGGIGTEFQANGTHAARTWYGSTNVAELKRLFGDNVSDYPQGYRKDMVRDANGQLSVTYYDKRGNTIVTALAGDAPKSLRKLDYSEETIITPLNDNNVKIGNSMVSEHTFLNTIPNSNITLDYSVMAAVQNFANQSVTVEGHEITFGDLCPDCAYTLNIVVKDQNGNVVGTPIQESLNPGSPCMSVAYESQSYNVALSEIGEYRIIKTLTVDEASMIAAFQAQLDAQGTGAYDVFLQNYLSTVDITACLTDCEDLCSNSVRIDYIQQHGEKAWYKLSFNEMKALIDACIETECNITNHDSEEEPVLEVNNGEACEAQRQRMLKQISPGGVLYEDHNSSFWISLGPGPVTINGTSYTIAQLQTASTYTDAMAQGLLGFHREYCIWDKHCSKWMDVQNASLYITTLIMNTPWPSSAPSAGNVFFDPYNSLFDHANATFGSLLTLQSLVTNYGANNIFPQETVCTTIWPEINSGNLYSVVNKLGDKLASQAGCLGNPMTTDEINQLKKQLFLGFYLNIKWQMVKQYAGCAFSDDNNAIFMIPPANLLSMQEIIDNAVAATLNLKSCHEKAIDNVNIWMGVLPSGCLSTLGISNFTSIAPYNSSTALALQSAYSSTSTSGGLVQLFYNYSRAVCEATTAPSPVNPNVLGLFYDPDPDNAVTDAPGEVQYDAIKTLLTTGGCNYSTTANLPFEVYPPATVTPPSPGSQTSQMNLTIALNALAETIITNTGCSTCTEQIIYRNSTPYDPLWKIRTVNDMPLPNGLMGSARYIFPLAAASSGFYPGLGPGANCYVHFNNYNEPDHMFQFEISDGTCKFYNKDFDIPLIEPVDMTTFCPNFVAGSVKLDRMIWYPNINLIPFYGNADPFLNLRFILGQDANYAHDVECNRSSQGFGYFRRIATDCGGSGVPSGELGNSFETIINLLPQGLDNQLQIDCIQTQIQQATADAQVLYNQVIENLWSKFYEKMKLCLNAKENFRMTYKLKEYQYTLYYYDLAGNLVQTVPPQGVKPFDQTQIDNCLLPTNTPSFPAHEMETRYMYNGLNALIASYTPDGGYNQLYLDKLYRVRYSQNPQQLADGRASYSKYDELGRVVEAGEFKKPGSDVLSQRTNEVAYPSTGIMDYTRTFYESGYIPPSTTTTYPYPSSMAADPDLIIAFGSLGQQNLRNAIGAVMHRQGDYDANGVVDPLTQVVSVISYSYDVHKNVKRAVHTNYHLADVGQQHMITDYRYDLISGNVEEVVYQKGKTDEYRHRYSYDANNRLVRSYTSHNGDYWELDAKYFYYLHGSLARRELGHDQVQGTDFAYNLQGWMKGVNSSTLDRMRDIGKDGVSNSDNQYFGLDAYGFMLGYYEGDYQAIKDAAETVPDQRNDYFAVSGDASDLNRNPDSHAPNHVMSSLYNGNITHMVTALRNQSGDKLDILLNNYQYDQLQRIREMKVYNDVNLQATNFFSQDATLYRANGGSESAFQENYTFDKNGNLLTLKRNGSGVSDSGSPIALPMDNFTYSYHTQTTGAFTTTPSNSNRLSAVFDGASGATNYTDDIDPGQADGNYKYNKNGQLISDFDEEIQTIEWTVTGKVKKITYTPDAQVAGKHDVKFIYDPMDRRIAKLVYLKNDHAHIKWTYYSYDAGGNVLATYERIRRFSSSDVNYNYYTDSYTMKDHLIYGTSRLGTEQENLILFNKGYKQLIGGTGDVEKRFKWLANPPDLVLPIPDYTRRLVGDKRYELSNHLGNVLEVISDRKVKAPLAETNIQIQPVYKDLAGVTVNSAGVITRTVAGTGWGPSGGASVEMLSQGDSFEWTLGGANAAANQYIAIGLSYSNTNSSVSNIKYGWYTHAVGLTILESGAPPSGQTYGQHGAFAPGGVLKIARINNGIQYSYNGTPLYTSVDPNPTTPMLIDFAFYEANRSIYNLKVRSTPRYAAEIVSYADYSPYGTLLGSRHGDDNKYRYGFQGQERDDEIKGAGNSYNYEYRMHDPRIGRFFACDPLEGEYPFYSPYAFSGNRLIDCVELEGLEPVYAHKYDDFDRAAGKTQKIIKLTNSEYIIYANKLTSNIYKNIDWISFDKANKYNTEHENVDAYPDVYTRSAYYGWVQSKLDASSGKYWFKAAQLVTTWNSVGAAESPVNLWYLTDDDEKLLLAGNRYLLNQNIFNAKYLLKNGKLDRTFTTAKGETISFKGLQGVDLDYALVAFEQTIVQNFLDAYKKNHSDFDMEASMKSISSNFDAFLANKDVKTVMDNFFRNDKGELTFNFASYDDRYKLGIELINLLRGKDGEKQGN